METADEVLRYMIDLFQYYLDEINDSEINDSELNEFILGQKYSFVECLEIIQNWKKAANCGLDYEIEQRYPLDQKKLKK